MTALRKATQPTNGPTPTLAAFIKSRRYQLGITQQEIARTIGIASADYLSLVESGKRRLELDRIPALAAILKVNVKELCQMALAETYPVVANAVFGTEPTVTPNEDMSNRGEQESFRKLMTLDRHHRQPILDTINTLYDMCFRSRKGA